MVMFVSIEAPSIPYYELVALQGEQQKLTN
jgi:NADH:ubiquinone oxidoreductase subunit 2 (subunit N)